MKIGLIGTVGHVGTVLDGIPKNEGARLVAACKATDDDDLSRIRGHAAFTDETSEYGGFQEMLDSEDLDLVGICRPYYLNAEAVIASARRGLHIICEKPVATELSDLEQIEKAVAASGIRLTAMLGMRLSPSFRAARQAVASGDVGADSGQIVVVRRLAGS